MSPRKGRTFTNPLTDKDRIVSMMYKSKGVITDFSVQYESFIDGEWIPISRIDTHEGPHRHMFKGPNDIKGVKTVFPCQNYNDGFTQARKFITEKFEHLKDNYLTQAAKERL